MATIQEKYQAAVAAMNHIAAINPTIVPIIKADYKGVYTAKLRQDVAAVRLFSASDADALDAFYSDPQAASFLSGKAASAIKTGLTNAIKNSISGTGQATAQVATGTGLGLAAATNPIGALFQAHIWIRVGEVALGLILIAVGVAKLTNAVPIATKIAKVVK